jgi:hypothetical protein
MALLDDFNRADSAASLGSNWTSPIDSDGGFAGSLGISSNQCYASSAFRDNYWNVTSFDADQEASVVVATLPGGGSCRLVARVQNPGAAPSAYYITVFPDGSANFNKIVTGTDTILDGIGGSGSIQYQAGDTVILRVTGTTLEALRIRASVETSRDSMTDSDISGGGFIGLGVGNDTATRFDDFGGGNLAGADTGLAWIRA